MNLPFQNLPTARRRRLRGGYMLTEIIVTIGLTTLAVSLATQLVMRILGTGYTVADGERADVTLDRAVQRLRYDTERAAALPAGDATVTLGPISWSVEANALVRREGDGVDRFDAFRTPPRLAVAGDRVTLQVGQQAWAFEPLIDHGGVQ